MDPEKKEWQNEGRLRIGGLPSKLEKEIQVAERGSGEGKTNDLLSASSHKKNDRAIGVGGN